VRGEIEEVNTKMREREVARKEYQAGANKPGAIIQGLSHELNSEGTLAS
jgi:hypothetical protein